MSYAIDDPMPGPGDIWCKQMEDEEDIGNCIDCGDYTIGGRRCEDCQDEYDAHIDDKLDAMRDEQEDY